MEASYLDRPRAGCKKERLKGVGELSEHTYPREETDGGHHATRAWPVPDRLLHSESKKPNAESNHRAGLSPVPRSRVKRSPLSSVLLLSCPATPEAPISPPFKSADRGDERLSRRQGGELAGRSPHAAGSTRPIVPAERRRRRTGAYMGVEAGGCGRRAVVTGFYVWGWEFLTALLLFSAAVAAVDSY